MRNIAISTPPTEPSLLLGWLQRLATKLRIVDGYEILWTPSSVSANSTSDQTVTVTGLNLDDMVYVNLPSYVSGVVVAHARVTGANTIAVTFGNVTGGSVTPPAGVYKIMAVRI
jgi:hypothetical protein